MPMALNFQPATRQVPGSAVDSRCLCRSTDNQWFAQAMPTRMLLLVIIVVSTAGCIETSGGRERAILQGKAAFETHCCGCHDGKLSDLAKIPPNLGGIFQRPRLIGGAPATDVQVRSIILAGRSGIMPSFRDTLSDEEIGNIIRYLHSIGPQTSPSATK